MIVTWPQLLIFTGTGATKSLTSAGNDADELLFRVIWSPQHGNELADRQVLVANPGRVGTDALVSHLSRLRVGLPPPLVKSKVTSRSPAVRLSVFGPEVVRSGWVFWLISKSIFAEPRLLVRSHARYRKLLLVVP